MIKYIMRWLGEILIDIGQGLVRSAREQEYVRIARVQRSNNRYTW